MMVVFLRLPECIIPFSEKAFSLFPSSLSEDGFSLEVLWAQVRHAIWLKVEERHVIIFVRRAILRHVVEAV